MMHGHVGILMAACFAVIKMNAMVGDYATALNRKSILHVRLKGVTGEDNFKVILLAPCSFNSLVSSIVSKQQGWCAQPCWTVLRLRPPS